MLLSTWDLPSYEAPRLKAALINCVAYPWENTKLHRISLLIILYLRSATSTLRQIRKFLEMPSNNRSLGRLNKTPSCKCRALTTISELVLPLYIEYLTIHQWRARLCNSAWDLCNDTSQMWYYQWSDQTLSAITREFYWLSLSRNINNANYPRDYRFHNSLAGNVYHFLY